MFARKKLLPSLIVLLCCGALPFLAAADTGTVEVEEIEVKPSTAESDTSKLWKETKQKTSAAATTAATYSKAQGTKILEASKTGVAKGADALSKGSEKAWDATKKATKSAAEYTSEKASKAGAVIADAVKADEKNPPVTDKSISE